jgi:tetratricopeptide (TPR) repeat protein
MERSLAASSRLLKSREFANEAEEDEYLNRVMVDNEGPPPSTPLEEAQELIWDAWEESSSEKKVALARKALDLSPDCADAYVLLAEETARDLREARALYQKGVEAGERALGEKMFAERAGDFWGLIETRPYMRARAGLAACLYHLGRIDEVIAHYEDMLRLNLEDNQGIRIVLLNCYMEKSDIQAARELLGRYEEDISTPFAYSRALCEFALNGPSKAANQALLRAFGANLHVPRYLLMMTEPSSDNAPPTYRPGSTIEAESYFQYGAKAWGHVPGSLKWLKDMHGRLSFGR